MLSSSALLEEAKGFWGAADDERLMKQVGGDLGGGSAVAWSSDMAVV
ncbi:hypothetical protein IMZ48_35735 [Candidatus Bathyarchaeota archaeon]|nr:hypothetical protein [Candidatus Bathyarchaeota archaeon]